ncbi:MAG: hypothetical protein RLZZ535_3880 [Cyanobacteriota bacterium]|jgi:hypothetical protein
MATVHQMGKRATAIIDSLSSQNNNLNNIHTVT